MNKKELQKRKTLVAKTNCYFSDQSKKLNQITMIQIVSKKHWVTHELQELICLQQTKELVLITHKRGVVSVEKKIWKSLIGKKHPLEKPVHFYIKNTVNNADTWGFIQQFFQYL